jgi:hypothetical protein
MADLDDIVGSIATGMATLTGLSASSVTDKDWLVRNNPDSLFVFPSGQGAQGQETFDSFYQLHYITIELWLKNSGDVQRLYTDAQTYIVAILAWFRANDTLSKTVETCHEGQLTYRAIDLKETEDMNSRTLYRIVSFQVPVKVTIDA